MARPSATDFLHNMRFHVVVVPPASGTPLPFLDGGSRTVTSTPAGFMSVSAPDMQIQSVMYKEGTWVYERKFPGEVSMGGAIQMQRGVARNDSSFWAWIRTVAEGTGEYRVDLDIKHFHRDQALSVAPPVTTNKTDLALDNPARVYHVFECYPTNHGVNTSGFDATNGEISIMSLDCDYEHFQVEEKAAA